MTNLFSLVPVESVVTKNALDSRSPQRAGISREARVALLPGRAFDFLVLRIEHDPRPARLAGETDFSRPPGPAICAVLSWTSRKPAVTFQPPLTCASRVASRACEPVKAWVSGEALRPRVACRDNIRVTPRATFTSSNRNHHYDIPGGQIPQSSPRGPLKPSSPGSPGSPGRP